MRELIALLDRLDSLSVRHVYWKQASGVGRALRGRGKDYDLLIAESDYPIVGDVLRSHRLRSYGDGRHFSPPGWENWLGFETDSGELIHLHVHTQLYTGRPGVYEYRLDAIAHILSHRRRDPAAGVWVLEPSLDLALLAIRACVEPKYTTPDGCLAASARAEMAELGARTARRAVVRHVRVLAGDVAGDALEGTRDEWPWHRGDEAWRAYQQAVRESLESARRVTVARGHALTVRRRLTKVSAALARRLGPAPTRLTRARSGLRLPHGRLVAVVGPDGAGKSTLVAELAEWLGAAFEVRSVYLGKGDPVSAAWHAAARAKWRVLAAVGRSPPPAADGRAASPGPVAITRAISWRDWAKALSSVSLGRELHAEVRAARRAATGGAIVITDRFPTLGSPFADGPRIAASGSPLLRVLSKHERASYERATSLAPDLVLRLVLDPDIAWSRKPDHDRSAIRSKMEALLDASFGAGYVVDIDATQPREAVLLEAKRLLWEHAL